MPPFDTQIDRKTPTLPEILQLRLSGMKYQEIADKFGTSKQNIQQRLQGILKLLNDPEKILAYQQNKSTILTALERELLDNLVKPDKIKKANFASLAAGFGIIYDKNRLEQGKTTSIVSYQDVRAEYEKLKAELKEAQKVGDVIDVTPEKIEDSVE